MKVEKKKVIYLDCDTMFTAFLRAGFLFDFGQQGEKWNHDVTAEDKKIADKTGLSLLKNENDGYNSKNTNENIIESKRESRRLIDIYLPSQGRFESILGDITSPQCLRLQLLFSIQSIGFYNMYPIQMSKSTSRLSQGTNESKTNCQKNSRGGWCRSLMEARPHITKTEVEARKQKDKALAGLTICSPFLLCSW